MSLGGGGRNASSSDLGRRGVKSGRVGVGEDG